MMAIPQMSDEERERIGAKLSHILDTLKAERGWKNDTDVAKHLDVSPASISRWRDGEIAPSARAILALFSPESTQKAAA